ncbi:Pyridoxamine 5'-phosphate oxidase-like FMN-binding protein [Tenacibaculum litopenaei]|uniref:pyridoxamine 5'-phosphate oxidase family protein n=1 Tax=Tenacibaculum litopenaei TaxID=396016 RepID=UPI0038948C01
MARFYKKIPTRIQQFIKAQKMFFVATAPAEGRVNLSPKGMDSFHIIDEHQVAWLSVTGSGNETSAHLLENGRITLMFCAFEGAPNIVRLYGTGKEILPSDAAWEQYKPLFPDYPGMRQIFLISVASVQTSCGSSIPFYDYKGERNRLNEWAKEKGEEGIREYWEEKNRESIDGLPTKLYKS